MPIDSYNSTSAPPSYRQAVGLPTYAEATNPPPAYTERPEPTSNRQVSQQQPTNLTMHRVSNYGVTGQALRGMNFMSGLGGR